MKLNDQLVELYRSKFDGIETMYSELEKSGIDDYSYPLLLHVWEDEYAKAPFKLMFFGQETNGWGAELSNIEEIPSAMSEYERFNMGRNYNSTFWSWIHWINQQFGNPNNNGFIWNNILKFGKNGSIGKPDRKVTELENKYFNVAQEEIAILKPDVCLFLCGPNYDERIREKFPDVEFNEVSDYPIREVAQLKSSHLPKHSYRTYHPGYGQRHEDWYEGVFEAVVNLVK